jgi:hypothetical protein
VSGTPKSVLYAAARTIEFQTPPHFRPAPDEILLLRWRQDGEEGEPNLWRFPYVDEFDQPAELEPWTEDTVIAHVDASFDPPGIPERDYFWCSSDAAVSIRPAALHPAVPAALERFVFDPLDQILARIARADSTTEDPVMSSTIESLQRQVDKLQRQIGPPAGDPQEFRVAQGKAQRVAQVFADEAPSPLQGERLIDYRVRLAARYQKHSKVYASANLNMVRDPAVLAHVEDAIFADAMSAARDGSALPPGTMRAICTPDPTGRQITSFVGSAGACWNRFKMPYRFVKQWAPDMRCF